MNMRHLFVAGLLGVSAVAAPLCAYADTAVASGQSSVSSPIGSVLMSFSAGGKYYTYAGVTYFRASIGFSGWYISQSGEYRGIYINAPGNYLTTKDSTGLRLAETINGVAYWKGIVDGPAVTYSDITHYPLVTKHVVVPRVTIYMPKVTSTTNKGMVSLTLTDANTNAVLESTSLMKVTSGVTQVQ